MDLEIRGAHLACAGDVFVTYVAATSLHARGDGQESFQLFGDWRLRRVQQDPLDQSLVVVQMTGGNGRMTCSAEGTAVQRGDVRADQLSIGRRERMRRVEEEARRRSGAFELAGADDKIGDRLADGVSALLVSDGGAHLEQCLEEAKP